MPGIESSRIYALALSALVLLPVAGAQANPLDVRLNEVQVLGTHNSYHIQPEQRILDVLGLFDPTLPIGLAYTHVPLAQQFSGQGIRQICSRPLGHRKYALDPRRCV